jgi:hypothetical protein
MIFAHSRRTLAALIRLSHSALAAMYAPLSGLYVFIRRCSSALLSLRNSSGVKSTDIQDLREWWEGRFGRSHDYVARHPEELTDYGRLMHLDFPALLARLARARSQAKG